MARREEEEPEVLDTFIGKRVGAYIIDLILPGLVAGLVFAGLFLGGDLGLDMGPIIAAAAAVGTLMLVQYLYFSLQEGFGRCTLGERAMGLEVALLEVGEDQEDMPVGGAAFVRNAPKLLLVVGGAITLAKYPFANCYFRPYTEQEIIQAPERRAWTPKEPEATEEDVTLREGLPFPEELLNGHCPKCGTPYRLNVEDTEEFSGLWNYRCTWCNYAVFDHFQERRTQPGFW